MNKSLLLGLWRFLLRIPRPIWQQEVARSARAAEKVTSIYDNRPSQNT